MTETATFTEVQKALEAACLTPDINDDRTVGRVCASDLMSDVLAFSRPKTFLLTGLATPQTVRTAEVADLLGICFVFNKEPTQETVDLAVEIGMPLFRTPFSLYTASGILYELGIRGCQAV